MPAKTTLIELQNAMEMEPVKSHLASYAVGIFVHELHKYRKEQAEAKLILIGLRDKGREHDDRRAKLKLFEEQPHLGFYFTIDLFDQLADTHPTEAQQMIEAVLSFDTMGRYLLEECPIYLDGKHFVLADVLAKHGIDRTPLEAQAKQNRLNAVMICDDIEPIRPVEKKPVAFSLPSNVETLAGPIRLALNHLLRSAEAVSECETLRSKATLFNYDFDLLSKSPTEENIQAFLCLLAEIFAHAKIQDSSKLDIINVAAPDGARQSEYSAVAFLDGTLPDWFLLSLVLAPTEAIFNQRMQFIMSVFTAANKISPPLPTYANADMYLPLFILSVLIMRTSLQYHPAVRPNLDIIHDMNERHNALAINEYTNGIYLSVDGKKIPLPPMRMEMTTELELGKEYSDLYSQHTSKDIARDHVTRGKAVYSYFKPNHLASNALLSCMSLDARALYKAQFTVKSMCNRVELGQKIDLLSSAFAVRHRDDSVHKQLQTLESALLSEHPRVYSQEKHLLTRTRCPVVCYENDKALVYIQQKVAKIHKKFREHKPSVPELTTVVGEWCAAISGRVDQLRSQTIQAKGAVAEAPVAELDAGAHSQWALNFFKRSAQGDKSRSWPAVVVEHKEQEESVDSRTKFCTL